LEDVEIGRKVQGYCLVSGNVPDPLSRSYPVSRPQDYEQEEQEGWGSEEVPSGDYVRTWI
jgi:hypothetical protein